MSDYDKTTLERRDIQITDDIKVEEIRVVADNDHELDWFYAEWFHFIQTLKGYKEVLDKMKGEPHEYVTCRECGKKFKTIEHSHLMQKHDMTIKEYEKKYPKAKRISTQTLLKLNGRDEEFWSRVRDIVCR